VRGALRACGDLGPVIFGILNLRLLNLPSRVSYADADAREVGDIQRAYFDDHRAEIENDQRKANHRPVWTIDEAIRLLLRKNEEGADGEKEVVLVHGERMGAKIAKLHDAPGSFRDAARRNREVVQGESLKKPEGYASSLRSYGNFVREYGERPFPVQEDVFLDFIALSNSEGTVNTHVAAMRKACRLIYAPFNVSDKGIQDVKNGLKRMRKGKKRVTCAFSLPLVWKILEAAGDEFRPIFGWCFAFALRIGEALVLQRGTERAVKRNELPDGRLAAVALVKGKVSIILDSRKNALAGDTVRRPCFCKNGERWKGLCPVHALMPEISTLADGDRFFSKTYNEVLRELKDVCARLEVDLPAPVGTHSIRRSAIQLMEKKGAEKFAPGIGLMGLGNHKSAAVNSYRDKKAVEEKAFRTAVLCELSDSDESEADC
jgi:hypothetical protein